MTSGHGFALR